MAKAAKSYMEAAIAGRDTGVKGAFKGGLQARMKAAAERQAQAQSAVETVVDLTADAIGASPRSARILSASHRRAARPSRRRSPARAMSSARMPAVR